VPHPHPRAAGPTREGSRPARRACRAVHSPWRAWLGDSAQAGVLRVDPMRVASTLEPSVRCSSSAALAPVPAGSFHEGERAACQRPAPPPARPAPSAVHSPALAALARPAHAAGCRGGRDRPAAGLAPAVRGGPAGLAEGAAGRRPAVLRQGHQRPADHLPRRDVPGLGPDGGGAQPPGADPRRLYLAPRAARQGDQAGGRPAGDAARPARRGQQRRGRRPAAPRRQPALRGRGRRVRSPHPPRPDRPFQRDHGLTPGGLVGRGTWGALVTHGRQRSRASC
jgi:hypothetical protein